MKIKHENEHIVSFQIHHFFYLNQAEKEHLTLRGPAYRHAAMTGGGGRLGPPSLIFLFLNPSLKFFYNWIGDGLLSILTFQNRC